MKSYDVEITTKYRYKVDAEDRDDAIDQVWRRFNRDDKGDYYSSSVISDIFFTDEVSFPVSEIQGFMEDET